MGVSKLPEDFKPERWELIFYIVGTPYFTVPFNPFILDARSNTAGSLVAPRVFGPS